MFCLGMASFASFIVVPLLLQTVIAQYTAEIQFPSGNETFNIIDTIIVQWNSSVANADTLDSSLSTPTLFTWFLDIATNQVAQLSQVQVAQTGTFNYSVQDFDNGLITKFQASLWFNLFYDTSVIATPNQEGFNGKMFNVYSNTNLAPTTWALTTSFAASQTGTIGGILPTGTSPAQSGVGTGAGTATSRRTSTATQIPTPTGTTTPHSTGGGGLNGGEKALIAIFVIVLVLMTGMIIWLVRWIIRMRKRVQDIEKLWTPPRPVSPRSTETSGNVFDKEERDDDRRSEHRSSDNGTEDSSVVEKSGSGETSSTGWV